MTNAAMITSRTTTLVRCSTANDVIPNSLNFAKASPVGVAEGLSRLFCESVMEYPPPSGRLSASSSSLSRGGGQPPTTLIRSPFATDRCPTTITRSPASSPESITTRLFCAGPSSTSRTLAKEPFASSSATKST